MSAVSSHWNGSHRPSNRTLVLWSSCAATPAAAVAYTLGLGDVHTGKSVQSCLPLQERINIKVALADAKYENYLKPNMSNSERLPLTWRRVSLLLRVDLVSTIVGPFQHL